VRCSSKYYRYCLCINSISLNREHKSRYVIHIVMSVTVLLLGVALVDPLEAMSGFSDNGPYSPIKEALSKVDHPRTLMLASFDDFYAIESNYIARAETSDTFVEKGYKTVLVAASFGEQSFNNYLHRHGVTHIIVPRSSADNGFIFHKWGNIGSINLDLGPVCNLGSSDGAQDENRTHDLRITSAFLLDDLMQIGILAQSLNLHNPVASRLNRSIKRASIICKWD